MGKALMIGFTNLMKNRREVPIACENVSVFCGYILQDASIIAVTKLLNCPFIVENKRLY